MRLTREKIVRLSHKMMDVLVASNEVEFVEDRDTIRQNIVTILTNQLREEEKMDAEARKKIASMKKEILEDSEEWSVLYRKFYAEELRRAGIAAAPRSIAAARKRTASRTQNYPGLETRIPAKPLGNAGIRICGLQICWITPASGTPYQLRSGTSRRSSATIVRFVDVLNSDHFHVGRDVICRAEIQHLLRFADAADS